MVNREILDFDVIVRCHFVSGGITHQSWRGRERVHRQAIKRRKSETTEQALHCSGPTALKSVCEDDADRKWRGDRR